MKKRKGYMLIILMMAVFVLSIGLLVTVPVWETQIQREKEEEFSDHLERLETIAATCLRILAGMPPGDDLDKYVREN